MTVLEISQHHCYVHTERGFLVLSLPEQDDVRIDLDHLQAVITQAHGIRYSQNALVTLAERNIILVLTDKRFNPVSIMHPISYHHAPIPILNAQIQAFLGQNKLFWQKIIQAKIKMQSALLDTIGICNHGLSELHTQVLAGDTRNIEAQAARKYWSLLFGNGFRRNRNAEGINALLNYGYTIYRSTLAREICASGLHPSIGIHHKHRSNAFCLADDLIEPYRPLVDYTVFRLIQNGCQEVDVHSKRILVNALTHQLRMGTLWQSVSGCMQITAQSLARAYITKGERLKLPKPQLSRFID